MTAAGTVPLPAAKDVRDMLTGLVGKPVNVTPGSPVTPDYASPFPFTGTLHEVTVDVSGDLIHDSESEMRMAMARQ